MPVSIRRAVENNFPIEHTFNQLGQVMLVVGEVSFPNEIRDGWGGLRKAADSSRKSSGDKGRFNS